MKSIRDIELTGKRVFIRVDFNVPLDSRLRVTDDSRIKGAMPTISYAVEQGARVILASHLGRPKGKPVPTYSLAPVAERLGRLFAKEVQMAEDCIGPKVAARIAAMANGDVILLENLRFHAGEQEDDDAFGRALADLCDVYVNDAFAVCHRKNASVSAITRHVRKAAAGLLLQRELDYFASAMAQPKRPLVAIIGGAKVSSKLGALRNMLQHVDKIIIGGAMANTFLKAKGVSVGTSLVEEEMIDAAIAVMDQASGQGIMLYLPIDVVVAEQLGPEAVTQIVPTQKIPEKKMALDIGPATSKRFTEALRDAGTIIWNGPMGVFEMEPFSRGTFDLANSVASTGATTIVGGGDTDAAIHQSGVADKITFISTGGGAFLTLMEGKTLPAVTALDAVAG
ncbi:Phosphoglycerate kinase (EC [Olavius algarvensis associated proteobacterium Delta 3]|nr:Phosphoglycerate kinase (EC [Olavius algarvensis associated proteobacterium Delta 3]CAB5130384.1 Phosphoglycerate kinase (EC [Olavius algarvensis associated proteobacterium Delta 3]